MLSHRRGSFSVHLGKPELELYRRDMQLRVFRDSELDVSMIRTHAAVCYLDLSDASLMLML